jgi:nucleotide-binding universal stress UspA family protein
MQRIAGSTQAAHSRAYGEQPMTDSSARIVGLDGSAGGRAALDFALCDAARGGATTEVVVALVTAETHAAPCGTTVGSLQNSTAQISDAVRTDDAGILGEVGSAPAAELRELPRVSVNAVGGDATRALLRAVEGADLLVVGTRGRGGFASTVLGSVGVRYVLNATCPVTVVHPTLVGA